MGVVGEGGMKGEEGMCDIERGGTMMMEMKTRNVSLGIAFAYGACVCGHVFCFFILVANACMDTKESKGGREAEKSVTHT